MFILIWWKCFLDFNVINMTRTYRKTSRKNAAVLLDFVQLRGGGGPCPNFLSLFISAFLVNKRSLFPQKCQKKFNLKLFFLGCPARARSTRARRACALIALGLLLADSALTVGRLFDVSTGFFYENGCNSGTESRKIVPKVENERSPRGLQMDC